MVNTSKAIEMLEAMQKKIDEKMDKLQEKMDALDEEAEKKNRNLTSAEQKQYDRYAAQMDELGAEYGDIIIAIDYLVEYVTIVEED